MTRSRSFSLITLKISDCVATTGTRRGGMETAKLERLVSKLLREGAARKEDGVQPLMNVLLARHVEYQRKPQSVRARRSRPSAELRLACDRLSLAQALKKSLRDALRKLSASADGTSHKREHSESENGDDDVDPATSEAVTADANLLNSSMRERYSGPSRAAGGADSGDGRHARRKRVAVGGGLESEQPHARARPKTADGKSTAAVAAAAAAARGYEFLTERPGARYSSLGGLDAQVAELRELIERPLQHPEVYAHLGVAPPRGVLLHGPSGCGKTVLAHAIAGELGGPRGVSFFRVSAPEIVASQVPPRSRSCSK